MNIKERYGALEDFEQLLKDAEAEASSEWEQEFVGDMNEKYGGAMFITEKQISALEKIVG